jgi:hypothetical protein
MQELAGSVPRENERQKKGGLLHSARAEMEGTITQATTAGKRLKVRCHLSCI